MKRRFKCIRLGLSNLPGYGSHPGTPALLFMVMAGAVIAGREDWHRGAIAAVATLVVMGGIYLVGAYHRGDDYLRKQERMLESLRWKADTVVTNPFGERVWLKACSGGITDCCAEDEPCDYHTAHQVGDSHG